MLTLDRLLRWVDLSYGFTHAETRVRDVGHAFLVHTQPDEQVGTACPTLVLKATGAYFHLGSNPDDPAVHQARRQWAFRWALRRTGRSLKNPDGYVQMYDRTGPPPVIAFDPTYSATHGMTPVELEAWLYKQFPGRRQEIDTRDVRWAFWIHSQSDAYLIIKRDRSVWHLPSDPMSRPLYSATDEDEFRGIWRRARRTEPFPDYWITR